MRWHRSLQQRPPRHVEQRPERTDQRQRVDVSSVKELARRWFPRAYYAAPAKTGNHRALADVQESIEELRYYREAMLVAAPGPERDILAEIAARHQGSLA